MADEARWAEARQEYITSPLLSYREISEKYGFSERSIERRAASEKWVAKRKKFGEQVTERAEKKRAAAAARKAARKRASTLDVTDELLSEIVSLLNVAKEGDGLCARDIKAIASALKDINEVRGVKSDIDLEEQRARIDKLKKDADRDSDDAKQITVRIEGGGEWSQ